MSNRCRRLENFRVWHTSLDDDLDWSCFAGNLCQLPRLTVGVLHQDLDRRESVAIFPGTLDRLEKPVHKLPPSGRDCPDMVGEVLRLLRAASWIPRLPFLERHR